MKINENLLMALLAIITLSGIFFISSVENQRYVNMAIIILLIIILSLLWNISIKIGGIFIKK